MARKRTAPSHSLTLVRHHSENNKLRELWNNLVFLQRSYLFEVHRLRRIVKRAQPKSHASIKAWRAVVSNQASASNASNSSNVQHTFTQNNTLSKNIRDRKPNPPADFNKGFPDTNSEGIINYAALAHANRKGKEKIEDDSSSSLPDPEPPSKPKPKPEPKDVKADNSQPTSSSTTSSKRHKVKGFNPVSNYVIDSMRKSATPKLGAKDKTKAADPYPKNEKEEVALFRQKKDDLLRLELDLDVPCSLSGDAGFESSSNRVVYFKLIKPAVVTAAVQIRRAGLGELHYVSFEEGRNEFTIERIKAEKGEKVKVWPKGWPKDWGKG